MKRRLKLSKMTQVTLQIELPLGNFNDVYFKLGELHHQQGDVDTAVNYFKQALALNPELADRFMTQGKRAFDEENYKDAIEPFKYSPSTIPRRYSATYLLGQSYEASGDADSAITFYERTLVLDPQRPDVLFKMVYIYREREAHQQAVNTLKRIIEIVPETTEAHYLLALSYLSLSSLTMHYPHFLQLFSCVQMMSQRTTTPQFCLNKMAR